MSAEKKINGLTFGQWFDELLRVYLTDYGSFPSDTKDLQFYKQWMDGIEPWIAASDFHFSLHPEEWEVMDTFDDTWADY